MAIIDGKGRLHGKVGNIVYRTLGNTAIVQSKPAKVKQTASTKESALEFGLASNAARIVRTAFFPLTYTAGGMINRLNGAVLKCIKSSEDKARGERDLHDGDLRHLEGFQFNKLSPLDEALKIRPTAKLDINNRLKVDLPAFKDTNDLQYPMYSQSCILRLMLVAVDFREDYYEYISYVDIEIDRRELFAGQEWYPEKVLPAGSIAFLSASLHYFGPSGMAEAPVGLNSKECSPAELLAVFKVPLADEKVVAESGGEKEAHMTRYPLNNYRGREILGDLFKLRQQQEKRIGKNVAGKTKVTAQKGFVLPKGKIEVQRE